MPQKEFSSLFTTCLTSVATNIEQYISGNPMPLHNLPACIIEKLITVLGHEKYNSFTERNLEFLIRPGLRRLNFRHKMWSKTRFTLSSLIPAGQNLTHLTLGFCKWLSTADLVQLTGHIPNISYLDLSDTQCFKEVLVEIAEKCPKIVSLILSETSVNDACMDALCFRDTDDHREPRDLSLSVLDISHTLVTALGAATVLKYLKHLKNFCTTSDSSVFVLYKESYAASSPQDATLKLERFHHPWPITDGNLVTVIDLCPYLKDILLDMSLLQSHTVQVLSKCENLESLTLKCGNLHHDLSFEGGVEPLLENIGKNLTLLEIIGLLHVDVSVIGFYCPKLRVLRISPGEQMKFVGRELHVPFKKLEQVSIMDGKGAQVLYILQNARNLNQVTLFSCSITDNDFLNLITSNPMRLLNTLTCFSCNELTVAAFLPILRKEKLKTIILERCQNITEAHRAILLLYASRHKLDVQFLWRR